MTIHTFCALHCIPYVFKYILYQLRSFATNCSVLCTIMNTFLAIVRYKIESWQRQSFQAKFISEDKQ